MTYVFYHKSDHDGQLSGAICDWFTKKDKNNVPSLVGCDHGFDFDFDSIPNGSTVYVVDLTLPWDVMKSLDKRCTLVWIDHHISKMNESREMGFNPKGKRSTKHAACYLTWKWFSDDPVPWGVELVSEYDNWNHTKYSIPFQRGLDIEYTGVDAGVWKHILEEDSEFIKKTIDRGVIIEKYSKSFDKRRCSGAAYDCVFVEKYNGIAMNAAIANSLTFDSVWDEQKYDIMVRYHFDGTKWTFSLYTTRSDVDVSVICASLGGGGHAQAAGFTWKDQAFPPESIIRTVV